MYKDGTNMSKSREKSVSVVHIRLKNVRGYSNKLQELYITSVIAYVVDATYARMAEYLSFLINGSFPSHLRCLSRIQYRRIHVL